MHTLEQLRSGALAGTRRLDLSCGLQTLPPEVFGLADTLEVLNLSGNQLSTLPHDLPRLRHLKVIFCSGNPFTVLPEVLGDCPALQVVGFKACKLALVPPASLPPALRWLILTDNALAQLPDALGERAALQKLMLAGNRLRELPASLAQAQQLELIRLSANRLETLPDWLTGLPRLAWLALAGNPLGWQQAGHGSLAQVPWGELILGDILGEGASGHIFRALHHPGNGKTANALALKLFKGEITSDGLPEHELAACLVAGQHEALCTPSGVLAGHPQGARGLLLPLVPDSHVNLAAPPDLQSCTRDVYPAGLQIPASLAMRVATQVADAVAHLHHRGVMHGDLYAHNILWNPTRGDALLSDFGAATLLPLDQAALSLSLKALEVRALGHLLQELCALAPKGELPGSALQTLAEVALPCLDLNPAHRPDAAKVAAQLRRA